MPVLKASVDPATKARFRALAAERGKSESELLRLAILAMTERAESSAEILEPDAEKADTVRMTVRMPRFLLEAVSDRARRKGMAPSRWVAAMTQSNIARQPVFTDAELSIVGDSNRELAAIGRNLNQIARALNDSFHETERVRLDLLAELRRAIDGNRGAFRLLVRASQNSWEVDGAD